MASKHPALVRFGLAMAVLALAIPYLSLLNVPAVGTFHDDGIYLVTAKALAEGHGYRIVSLPWEPAQTKYPILFPALLSIVWSVSPDFPNNLPWLKAIPLVATVAWLLVSRRLLRVLGASPVEAVLIVSLVAVSPWVVYLSTSLLSETVFALIVVLALVRLTHIVDGAHDLAAQGMMAGVLCGAAMLTRSAGVALVVAGAASLLAVRRWRAAGGFLVGCVGMVGPWYAWVNLQSVSVDAYYTASNYGSWNVVASYSVPEKLTVIATNALLAAIAPAITWAVWDAAWLVIPGVLLLAATGRGMLAARRQPAVLFMAIYLSMLMLWLWPPQRFLMPVLPLLAWLAWSGAGRLKPVVAAAAAAMFVGGIVGTAAIAREGMTVNATSPRAGLAEDWARMRASLEWIDHHAPRDAVLAGNLDPVYYLYTGRPSVRAFSADPYLLFYEPSPRHENPLGSVEAFRQRLAHFNVGYLLLERGAAFGETEHLHRLVQQLQAASPGALRLCAGDPASGYVVYRVERSALQ